MGTAHIEYSGKRMTANPGMEVPFGSFIVTGNDGRVSVCDDKEGRVIFIGPGKRQVFNRTVRPTAEKSHWLNIVRKQNTRFRSYSVAAVRGEGDDTNDDIDWAGSSEKAGNSVSAKGTGLWRMYSKREYQSLIEKTENLRDEDSRFLRGMSLYMNNSGTKSGEMIQLFKWVTRNGRNSRLKMESRRMLGVLHFERGSFDKSLRHLKEYVRYRKLSDIDDVSYYMLIINSRIVGVDNDEARYTGLMRKYHKNSPLLKKL